MILSVLTHVLILLLHEGQEQRPTKEQQSSNACLHFRQLEALPSKVQRPYTVLVEGNIGAGKSTFVDILATRDTRIQGVPEPVDVWQNFAGTGVNLLDLMFKNGTRWSGAFQLASTLSRLHVATANLTEKATKPPVRIMERSIYSERYCFLEMMQQSHGGQLSQPEYALMDRWFQFASERFEAFVKPDIVVYLRSDVETLRQHIKKRGRQEEANIDPEFIKGLQRCHEDWLYYQNSTFAPPAPVIVANASLTLEDFTRQVLDLKDTIIPPDVFNGQ